MPRRLFDAPDSKRTDSITSVTRAHEALEVVEQAAQLLLALAEEGRALVHFDAGAVRIGRRRAVGVDDGVELFEDLRKALQPLLGRFAHLGFARYRGGWSRCWRLR